MLESLQTGVFDYEKLKPEEMQRRGILGRLVGIMADSVNPTRNGRAYSKKLWENVFANPIMQERIENKCCFGELGHPTDREETDMSKIAICMDGLPKVDPDGKLRAVFNILDTPNGRILKTLCDYGCNIGISSRGSGDLITDFDGNESVDPDTYNCEGWDAVLIPAVKEARLQYVTESLDKKRYNKTLRTRLQEAVEKETEENKKAMTESLHTFGIRLNEDVWDEIEQDSTEPEAGPEPNEEFVDQQDNMGESNPEESTSIGDIISEEPVEGAEEDIIDEPIDDTGDADIPVDDMFEEPEPTSIEYKGASIIKDEETGKFVCEIDDDTYVFNSEKNAKLWIDMNSKQVEEDRVEKELDKALEDPNEETFEDKPEENSEEEPKEEENLGESLNEEQIGRDNIKDAKSESEVLEPEKDEDEKEDKEDKVTISIKESFDNENKSDEEIIDEFLNRCESSLNEFPNGFDAELELPVDRYTDDFWYDLDDESRRRNIYLSLQECDEHDGWVYLYYIIKRRNIDESLTEDWTTLTVNEQFAVEKVIHMMQNHEFEPNDYEEFEWAVAQACRLYTNADYGKVKEYLLTDSSFAKDIRNYVNMNESSEKINLESLNYSDEDESSEAVNDGAEMNELQEALKNNFELEKQIRLLQEKLSASNAREKSLKEEVESYKAKVSKLSEVSKKNKALTEKLNTAEVSKDKLNESLEKVKSLTEELKAVKRDNNSVKSELEKMNEAYAELDKDLGQVREQYGKRFERQNQLLEKYQKITKNSIDRYINLQANNLGVKTSEIRNKLPEKFSFSDIDLVCEDLRNYKLNVSKLPFSTHKLNENINMRVNNVSQGLIPTSEIDELNDYDMKLMEMYK